MNPAGSVSTTTWYMVAVWRMFLLRLRRKLRPCCPLVLTVAIVSLYLFGPVRPWIAPTAPADDPRPRAFYRWIDRESGRTLNGTKPPVYGLFMLLDLDSTSGHVTSRRAGDFLEHVSDHDFGFSSCHQVGYRVWKLPTWHVARVGRSVASM